VGCGIKRNAIYLKRRKGVRSQHSTNARYRFKTYCRMLRPDPELLQWILIKNVGGEIAYLEVGLLFSRVNLQIEIRVNVPVAVAV